MTLSSYINIIRVRQWYKNLVIFLPLFFLGELFSASLFFRVVLGFFALCFISSSGYVLNDLIDKNEDKRHPEKKARPLASGAISSAEAIALSIVFFLLALYISYNLSIVFMLCVIFLFGLTLFYSLYLKKEPVADVIAISINFVVRAVSGAFLLKVIISPWLVLCPFFLALLLAIGKRDAEIRFNPKKASLSKEVLKHYSKELVDTITVVSATALLLSYSMYSFSRSHLLLLTLPFAVYVIFRYLHLVQKGSAIGRHFEQFYKDWRILVAVLLWGVLVFVIFYFILGKIDLWALV